MASGAVGGADSVDSAKKSDDRGQRLHTIFLAFFCFLVSELLVKIYYPGWTNPDSSYQLAQVVSGDWTDWHPPVMVWLWSHLRWLGPAGAPLFLLHVALYGTGLWLLGASLIRDGRRPAAWVLFCIGVAPFNFLLMFELFKDVALAVSLMVAVPLVFFARETRGWVRIGCIVGAVLSGTYAGLVRANGSSRLRR